MRGPTADSRNHSVHIGNHEIPVRSALGCASKTASRQIGQCTHRDAEVETGLHRTVASVRLLLNRHVSAHANEREVPNR